MKAAIYCRVSTLHQKEKGYSLDWQRENMPIKAKTEGYIVTDDDIYVEAESGTSTQRAQFKQMMQKVEAGEYQAIFVAEKSRLSRIDDPMEAGEIIRKVLKYNCRVYTANVIFDPSHPEGRFHWMIDDAVNVYEIQKTKQRFRNGKIQKLTQGGYVGGTPPTGYRAIGRDPETGKMRFDIDEDQADMIKAVFQYAKTGMSFRAIERRLFEEGYRNSNGNRFYVDMISKWLRNPHYAGYTHSPAKDILVEGNNFYPPIISKEDYWSVQDILGHKQTRDKRVRHPLSGILMCGNCGRGMKADSFGRDRKVYTCPSKWLGDSCSGDFPKSIYYQVAHDMVASFIPDMLEDLNRRYAVLEEARKLSKATRQPTVQRKQTEMEKVKKQIDNLLEQQSYRFSASREDKLAQLEERLKELARQLEVEKVTPIKPYPEIDPDIELDKEAFQTIVPVLFSRISFVKDGHWHSHQFRITRIVTPWGEVHRVKGNNLLVKEK